MTTNAAPDLLTRLQRWLSEADTAWKHDHQWLVTQIGQVRELVGGAAAELTTYRAEQARLQEEKSALNLVELMKEAKQRVEASVLYKRFIDGTPLENDIAVWMADFAHESVQRHGQIVGQFLNELYAVMVDPCAEGVMSVKDMKAALLQAAVRDRDAEAQVFTLTAALRRYGQHMFNCDYGRNMCSECGTSRTLGHHEDSYNGDTSWHPFKPVPCDCGFAAVLRAASEGA